MKLDSKKLKGQWFEYKFKEEAIKVFVRPFSAFVLDITPGESATDLKQDTVVRIIDHCVSDWDNVFDENGKKLECTKENKLAVCESLPDFLSFLMDKSQLLREEIMIKEPELKNSLKSQDGGQLQKESSSPVTTAKKQ